jgi:hypothetical protein
MNIEDVIRYLKRWKKEGKTGNIQVNFFKGGIPNINLNQSLKEYEKEQQLNTENN